MMVEGFREQSRSLESDAGDREPFFWLRAEDACDASEAFEQGSRCRYRDARHRGQHGLGGRIADAGLRSLGISGPDGRQFDALTADRQAVQPSGAVALVVAPKECDAEINDCKTNSSNRVGVDGSAIEVGSLNEQVRISAPATQLPDLAPQMSLCDGAVEVEDTFALDDGVGADEVIPCGQRGSFDQRPEFLEKRRDTAAFLMNIDDDSRLSGHRSSVSVEIQRSLALFRRKSA
jgi:hypothetical protein